MADASASGTKPKPIVAYTRDNAMPKVGPVVAIAGNIGPLANLQAFSIRNGDITKARSLLVKPTLSKSWHWMPVPGLPHSLAIKYAAVYVRVAYTHLENNRPTGMSDDILRKAAIILGIARAVITCIYEISDGDLIPGERADPLVVAARHATNENEYTFSAVDGTPAAILTSLGVDLQFTDVERAAISAIHMCAIGIPPLQGYSLFMTQHHYLSDEKSQSRRAFKVVEKAYWRGTELEGWFDAAKEVMQDVLWHKVGHPLNLSLKMGLSQSLVTRDMLIQAGCGPAASRLPALESEVRAALTYKTLLQTVRPMYETMGGETSMVVLEEAIKMVDVFQVGMEAAANPGFPSIPANVKDRASAVRHLAHVCSSNTDTVAHAYGFYCAMNERVVATSGANNKDTLTGANSLRKLDSVSPAAYHMGRQFYEDYTAKRMADRAAGIYAKMNLIVHGVTSEGTELFGGDPNFEPK